MVRRRVGRVLRLALCLAAAACGRDRDTAERSETPDTMAVHRALENAPARDSLLDTMPGGEMARGDSAAEMRLLKEKM